MAEDTPHVGEKASIALLIVDMISSMDFDGSDKLFDQAYEAALHISDLKTEVKKYNIPVVYVNDNYGRWQSDFKELVASVREEGVKGKPIADLLFPDKDDYFVLKPQFSAFFATPLELLLEHLEVKTLIITGVSGNMCIQFTANDAYMRDYQTLIPADCTASITKEENDQALDMMKNVLKADITPSTEYEMPSVIKQAKRHHSKK
ncbi:isochorismatase family cysteine hydrolase [Alteribacillus iranensis]|uniref:Nicotinamidase-related amidase n=1 Tax=Alteribacillus iranensis TaxID=930128 RepID=A0A1I2ES01_9BACI|nr:isochorismatase family cysteine hydrolase [Alteribacillus iranensis]SFE95000.1 Nicotinamidase-related amidase [Alteribacillus iranensis]